MKKIIIFLLLNSVNFYSQTKISDIQQPENWSRFGATTALSGDGKILAISSPKTDESLGIIKVYIRDGENWKEHGQNIKGREHLSSVSETFGYRMELSYNGSFLLISDISSGHTKSGKVWVFKFNYTSKTWDKVGDSIVGKKPGDNSGNSIAISNDGKTIAISSLYNKKYQIDNDIITPVQSGYVRVFKLNSNGTKYELFGQEITSILPHLKYGYLDYFGFSISLSGNGNYIAITSRGSVFIYEYKQINTRWSLSTRIDKLNEDDFYSRVWLSENAKVITLGMPVNYKQKNYKGYIASFNFDTISKIITKKGVIIGVDDYDYYGNYNSFSVSSDGNIVAIGTNNKITRVYNFLSNEWKLIDNGIYNTAKNFGWSTSLSKNGTTLAVGAPNKENTGFVSTYSTGLTSSSSYLSTNSFTEKKVSISPNPVKKKLKIILKDNYKFHKLEVIDINGKSLLKNNKPEINVSHLKQGIYILKIDLKNEMLFKKIIKL
ncbi:putative secreted protein (Por secretion system target) [Lutibacter sp. Hel_I_33_5]|uniref:T9SS type A sorting domain-containing protein n=1 Tax=Lutibacter sp. Hel_I_33_5 TaxID=1566289 RepID=UPI00119E7271|nr:T9SS type A sorting domain-containing protein [Lutibacter sp. Hel_I_33_5]TVZ55253.1 putative secreted protein (Por secretion system target) [Lutibacter sp. Hel_I_33_5]